MDRQRNSNAYHVEWYFDGTVFSRDVTVRIGRQLDSAKQANPPSAAELAFDIDDGIKSDSFVSWGRGCLLGIESGRADDAVELGRVAWIPGLVNAHTHLEFSLLTAPIPTAGRFTDWIRAVVGHRRENPGQVAAAIRRGTAECLRSGTTLIGDIATTGWHDSDYQAAGFSGVLFQELLGLGDERVAQQCELARTIAAKSPPIDSEDRPPRGLLNYGLSPHAPYSVHPDLLIASLQIADQNSRPVAMHLAESPAELQLLAEGTGDFRELLTDFGIWREELFGGRTPMQSLILLASCPRALVVHGNYLNELELKFLAAQPRMTLVYCPRTHAAFGHPDHPWQRLLEMGGNVAIGTDSRASNPDLSLFAELQFLAARHPEVSHVELLKLGSSSGRRALLGNATDKNLADFCVVKWDADLATDPVRTLFAAGNRVVGTMMGGHWCYAEDGFPVTID